MPEYKLKIDGTEYNQVQDSESWTKTILRDFNDRIFRTKGDFQFKGWGTLFDLIYGNLAINGVCNSLEGRIYFREDKVKDYAEWWRGEIKMQDSEFDLIKQSADNQVLENVWAAKFAQSDSQKVFIESARSKNEKVIAPCPSIEIDFFLPSTGSYSPVLANKRAYKIFDVFQFLVNYHTDNEVTFTSDFFTSGEGNNFVITKGSEIRWSDDGSDRINLNPEVSFNEVFEEMNKKFCLWIIIESDDFDNPVLRIEPQSYVFENKQVITVENPENIRLNIALDQLYTKIDVGSDETKFNSDPLENSSYPNVQLFSWNDESYNTSGDCQFENNTLNLVSTWKIDTNTFQRILLGLDDSFDDDVFIVEIDPDTLRAEQFQTDYTSSDTIEYIYNYNLQNSFVLNNWFDGIPQDIAKFYSKDYYFYADSPNNGTMFGLYNIVKFDNDTISPAQDYDNIYTTPTEDVTFGGQFKAPLSGFYTFNTSVNVTMPKNEQVASYTSLYVTVYSDDSLSTEISNVLLDSFFNPSAVDPLTDTLTGSINLFLQQNNVAVVRVLLIALSNGTINSGYFNIDRFAGGYVQESTQLPLIYEYTIEKFKLSLSDFNTLDNNLGYIRFLDTKQNVSYDVWASELKYNPVTQIVEVGKFIGRQIDVQNCEWILSNGVWDDDGCWDDNALWID